MINVSDTFKQKLQDGEKVWQEVEITFPDGTVKTVKDEIMGENCTYSDCAESSSFPIGCVVCKSMTLELDNTSDQWGNYNFYMAKVHAYIKMQTSVASPAVTDELLDENYDPILDQSGNTILATKAATEDRIETIDKGIYTITTPEQYGEILSFTALDDMYKTNATYASKLVLPQTVMSLVRDACETLDIPMGFSSMAHGNLIINEIPDNMTFRQLFGWAAMLETANARLDNRCYLQFVKWDFSAEPIELKDYIDTPTVSSDNIVITGIKVKSGDNSELYGESGYVIELENNLVGEADLATVAAQIGDAIIGAKFRNLQGDMAFNPLLEFGDMTATYDRNMNKYLTPLTDVSYTINGKTTVKTQADDPIRGMSKFVSDGTKAIVEARRLVKIEKTEREKAVERLAGILASSGGLYMTEEPQEDGSTIYYMHNKPTLEESDIIWKLTAEAFAVSIDGGKTYPYGFAVTGELITRLLYAEGINATYINTGALIVKDKNEKVIFEVDMDKKSVYMDPDTLTIGGMPLSKKLASMDENIASAKNMTFQLSNDMQTITSDADGNIPVFPTVTTTAKVMYGSSDITNDCSFTVTKSDSVTGSWDVDTHTYTVTGLSADNGWVDIKATYLINLSITKRFTISKQKKGKDGKDGEPGRTYMVETSCNVLKRGSDKTISPNFITFKAYYRDGKSATRVPYKGRFVVEETADGNTWNTIYTSSTDEDTVTHYLYSILTNGSGQTVASSNGSTVGIPRDVTNVRCKLYASGGTTTLMDMQSVAVVIDVDNLTQSQIVEILSNDGAWKGLYYKNGQLYISFSAALGGELTLGGVNNGNGVQKIFNEKGVLSEKISNGGAIYYNDKGKATAIIKEGDIYAFYGTGVELSDTEQKVSGICFNGYGMYGFMGTVKESSNNTVYFTQDYIRVPYEDEYGQTWWVDPIRIEFNDDMSNYDATFCAEYLNVYKRARFDVAPEFSTRALGISSSASALGVEGEHPYETMVVLSSSSKRYKDLGDSITPEELKNWYKIEPLWAKYKDGYLVEGDENEGRYIPMFIAEDVEEYFPEATRHQNGLVEDWNERIMIPAMFAMLKAQKKKIDQQEKLINKLCEKLNIE